MRLDQITPLAQAASDSAAAASLAVDSLYVTVKGFSEKIMSYAVTLAAVGALAMAIIELVKKIFNIRAVVHARYFTKWFIKLPGNVDHSTAYGDLIQLCTGAGVRAEKTGTSLASSVGTISPETSSGKFNSGAATRRSGHAKEAGGVVTKPQRIAPVRLVLNGWGIVPEHALFALESSQMMATLQESVDVALAAPFKYPALFDAMTSGASVEDVDTWLNARTHKRETNPESGEPIQDAAAESALARRERESFARIRQSVMRRLDGFQIFIDLRWGSINQLLSNIVGAIIMFLALSELGQYKPSNPLKLAALSLIGGILAPVAKDLVSALRKAKES